MSLVNDMLRDLDRRKSVDQPTLREDGSGLSAAPTSVGSRFGIPRLFWVLVLIALVLGGYFIYGLYNKYQRQLEGRQGLNNEAQKLLTPKAADSILTTDENTAEVQIEQLGVSEIENGARIEMRLSQVLQHRVIALDTREIAIDLPGAQLSQLLPNLTDSGLIQAIDVATQDGGLKFHVKLSQDVTFQTYLLNQSGSIRLIVDFIRVKAIGQTGEQSVEVEAKSDELKEPESTLETMAEEAESAAEDVPMIARESVETLNPVKPLISEKPPIPVKPPVAVRPLAKDEQVKATFNKTSAVLSVQEKERLVTQQAVQLVRAGQVAEAINRLQALVEEAPEAFQGRSLLANLYLQQRDYPAVEKLLAVGLEYKPGYGQFVISMARALMEQSRDSDALALLKKHEAELRTNISFLSLLAPLLQRQELHAESVRVYRALLRYDSGNAQWWIGLAISLEAQGAKEDALQAYIQARRIPQIDARLIEYANDRIGQLR